MKAAWANPIKVEIQTAKILQEMSEHGWLVDVPRMDFIESELTAWMDSVESVVVPRIPLKAKRKGTSEVKKPFLKSGEYTKPVKAWYEDESINVWGPFTRIIWEQINIGSDKQVKEYLLTVGWKPTEYNYRKNTYPPERTSPKLTEDSFGSLKDDTGSLIAGYLQLKHRRSMVQGWHKFIREDGRMSQVISGMTPTFRCTHKQIVNVPGGDSNWGLMLRSCFIASPGYKMVGIDAASCQLRKLCHYMDDYLYTDSVVNGNKDKGTDIHTVNKDMTGGMITTRTDAKRLIYGLLFGAGDSKLGQILNGNATDGARLRQTFMSNLPTLKKLLQGLLKSWKAKGYLVGLDGRKIYIRAEHMLLVYLLQAAEAIFMKTAMCFLYKWVKDAKLDAHIVGFIHDEIQAEVADKDVEEYCTLAKKAFTHAGVFLKLKVPTEGDPAVGLNWADTH